MSVQTVTITDFDHWVGENNIPERYEYGKGWWDYVEVIRRFSSKLEISDVRVIGKYFVHTPPPEERLPMPAVAMTAPGVTAALKWDFGALCRWPREWTVSIRRDQPYLGPLLGLFDPTFDLRQHRVDGFGPEFVYGPFCENPREFSCEVEDEWDVAMLLRLMLYDA